MMILFFESHSVQDVFGSVHPSLGQQDCNYDTTWIQRIQMVGRNKGR